MSGPGEPDAGGADKGRSWREVRAEAFERYPELDSAQARLDRARMRAESLARIRVHELSQREE